MKIFGMLSATNVWVCWGPLSQGELQQMHIYKTSNLSESQFPISPTSQLPFLATSRGDDRHVIPLICLMAILTIFHTADMPPNAHCPCRWSRKRWIYSQCVHQQVPDQDSATEWWDQWKCQLTPYHSVVRLSQFLLCQCGFPAIACYGATRTWTPNHRLILLLWTSIFPTRATQRPRLQHSNESVLHIV